MPAAKKTTDHQVIRRWVEQHGGHPATVKRTRSQNNAGLIRIDFPGFSGEGSLEPIDWDEWFSRFDSQGLAFLYQEGKNTNFNKLVRRDPDEERASDAAGDKGRNARGGRPKRVATTRGRRNASGKTRAASANGSSKGKTSASAQRGAASDSRAERAGGSRSGAQRGQSSRGTTAGARSQRGSTSSSRAQRASEGSRAQRTSGSRARTPGARAQRASGSQSASARSRQEPNDLQQLTKAELLARARDVDLPQRSGMSKAELVRALRGMT